MSLLSVLFFGFALAIGALVGPRLAARGFTAENALKGRQGEESVWPLVTGMVTFSLGLVVTLVEA